jgi:hypothetical protein
MPSCARFSLALFVSVASLTTAASAQDAREQARAAFNRGVERYEAADFEEALVAFQEAFRLAPHPSVRVNMANCYERLGRPSEAIFHYERFLAEGENVPPAQRREVEQTLATLRLQVGTVRLTVRPEGATVRIDGGEARRGPFDPLALAPGRHSIEVSLDGFRTSTREVTVSGGRAIEVAIELERIAEPLAPVTEPVAEPEPEPDREPAETEPSETAEGLGNADEDYQSDEDDGGGGGGFRLEAPTIVSGVATGVVLVTAAVLGIVALGAQSDFDDAHARAQDTSLSRSEREAAYRESVDASDRADAFSLTADILGIAGVVGIGVTAALFFTQDGESESAAQVGVAPIAGGGAVLVRGGL